MDELEVTIGEDTLAAIGEELELEAEDRDGHLAGFLYVLLNDTELIRIADAKGEPAVRFQIHKLDWERIKAIAGDALIDVEWDEVQVGKEEGR